MSDHVKFYDYYIVEGPEVQALIESFEPISQKRSELIKEAMTLVEAVGWSTPRVLVIRGIKYSHSSGKQITNSRAKSRSKDEAIWIRYR